MVAEFRKMLVQLVLETRIDRDAVPVPIAHMYLAQGRSARTCLKRHLTVKVFLYEATKFRERANGGRFANPWSTDEGDRVLGR